MPLKNVLPIAFSYRIKRDVNANIHTLYQHLAQSSERFLFVI